MSHTHRYLNPRCSRPADLAFSTNMGAGPQVATGLIIRGLEVVQCIQSIDNSVRLIADKDTVVRLYIDPANVSSDALVTGELAWRHGGGGFSYLPAMNRIQLVIEKMPTVLEQRFDIDHSLNFRLPAEAVREGKLQLQVNRLYVPGASDIPLVAPPKIEVEFRRSPVLRVRAIGLRYKDSAALGGFVSPDAIHFSFLRSYLQRAYPVAVLDWSQLVVDADFLNPPFGSNASDLANAQLAAIRAREVSSGIDPRTHYYGLVSDNRSNDFMRGSAVYDAATRIFGVIASGPVGVPNGWSGDTDASYADWYGAHELGHTFQRRHPGFPENGQSRDPDENSFPYPLGLITTLPDNKFVGFDVGDPSLLLPMRVLPGELHHDVMTYDSNQWLSAYTYEAIHDLLLDEEVRLLPKT